jgi:DNA polymerase sigma
MRDGVPVFESTQERISSLAELQATASSPSQQQQQLQQLQQQQQQHHQNQQNTPAQIKYDIATPTSTKATALAELAKSLKRKRELELDEGGAGRGAVGDEFIAFASESEDEVVAMAALGGAGAAAADDEAAEAGEEGRPPWAASWPYTDPNPAVNLHREILDFAHFCEPTVEETSARQLAVDDITRLAKELFPGCEVHLFGSLASGLHLPSSDIDVVIVDRSIQTIPALRALGTSLRVSGVAERMEVLERAKVPIAKFVHSRTGFSCDVCVNVLNGPDCTREMRHFVREYPPLKPLLLVLKQFLADRGLNEPFTGGMGSFLLCLTIVSHLQNLDLNFPFQWRRESLLGDLLAYYLKFWGRDFNHIATAVHLSATRPYTPRDSETDTLELRDPQNADNDVGRGCFQYFQVRRSFGNAFMCLHAGSNGSVLSQLIKPDNPGMIMRARKLRKGLTSQLPSEFSEEKWRTRRLGALSALMVDEGGEGAGVGGVGGVGAGGGVRGAGHHHQRPPNPYQQNHHSHHQGHQSHQSHHNRHNNNPPPRRRSSSEILNDAYNEIVEEDHEQEPVRATKDRSGKPRHKKSKHDRPNFNFVPGRK